MKKKRVVVSVISDLVSDQRVHRVCTFLHENDYDVCLIGRKMKDSLPLEEREYFTERIHCIFKKGVLAYAEFHLKLFLRLLSKKADVFLANDLDTLIPNFIHAQLRRKKLVYDTHEYFTGMPELQQEPFKRNIWRTIEKVLLPKIKYIYTVNQSVALQYAKDYNVQMKVVRNVPVYHEDQSTPVAPLFPKDKFVILLQGAGINEGRGGEELIQSMLYLPDSIFLAVIGSGDIWDKLVGMAIELGLEERILFINKLPFQKLKQYTRQAQLGVSLDKPFCLNYELSLPNKIFDYIHAGIPILSSLIREVKKIIEQYEIGTVIDTVTPGEIAQAVMKVYNNIHLYEQWKRNTRKAAKELNWQKEQAVLKSIFSIQ